jgi:hypothetical protein
MPKALFLPGNSRVVFQCLTRGVLSVSDTPSLPEADTILFPFIIFFYCAQLYLPRTPLSRGPGTDLYPQSVYPVTTEFKLRLAPRSTDIFNNNVVLEGFRLVNTSFACS